MNSTGRHSGNSGYLVILLLVVGLTAFSHSMKELTEIHQLSLDASRLVAQWSGNVTPAEIPQTIVRIEKLESCESKQSAPAVELPWVNEAPELQTAPSAVVPGRTQQLRVKKVERTVTFDPSKAEIAKIKKFQRVDADAFEVRIPSVQFPEADEPVATEFPTFTFKAKARRPGTIKINPRDREMILKTLNRSINLRIAS